ncbi:MAG TPA: phosphatidylglycerol lysyltransferase domain-containing protein [Candidatus Omnitrophota bacterium]|nr:phosphatidylglycerol lysyltransferase domain-containing protein [Candidatus Omnitrophota bacterium]
MRIEKLSLSHKKLLYDRFKNTRSFLSEFSFANLYLFREVHDHQVLMDGDMILISGRTYDGRRFVMPTTDIQATDVERLWTAVQEYDFIFPVAEQDLEMFSGQKFRNEFDEGDSDYVYTIEKLSTYKGRKLHGKKNLLNQFLDLYTPEARPLTRERMADAVDILETWQVDVGEDKNDTDYYPCREAFDLYDELVLCGGIYYVEKEPAGLIIGEEIHENMFALHFAKGKRKFKGLYQYMFNQFAKILPRQYEYLNFEQDLGKLALRIAKSSYDPDMILKKYRICPLK